MEDKYFFHVHTHRCGHASNETDEMYIHKAIKSGAKDIVFTDHAPFPNDPFSGRMHFWELPEYISSLKNLKKKYKNIINVHIGLEIEYLPSFHSYYDELKANKDIEVLMLGQHHYEIRHGFYNFQIKNRNKRLSDAFSGLMHAQIQGIKTGYFNVVAHPDRCFQFASGSSLEYCPEETYESLINAAKDKNIILEKNLSSMTNPGQFVPEFWKMVPDGLNTVIGCDAHSVNELRFKN